MTLLEVEKHIDAKGTTVEASGFVGTTALLQKILRPNLGDLSQEIYMALSCVRHDVLRFSEHLRTEEGHERIETKGRLGTSMIARRWFWAVLADLL